jgi:hypothetical protein
MKKNYLNPCLVLLLIFTMLFGISCKKTEFTEPIIAFNKVKVYDDTLADIRNASIHIAASSNMIYMTYGINPSDNGALINGVYYVTNNIYYANLMATDYEGNLKWKHTLPKGRVVGDIITLDDGSCVVASYQVTDDFFVQPNPVIYLVHFDKNGQIILEDSVAMTDPDIKGYNSVHLSRSINNNLILSGEFRIGDIAWLPYTSECDLNFKRMWDKTDYNQVPILDNELGGMSKGIVTPDQNYLFVRNYTNGGEILQLVKTNPTGGILWEKTFSLYFNTVCNDFIKNANCNYQFSFTTGYDPEITGIYEVNANGDSLNGTILSTNDIALNSALVPKDQGGVFALMNPPNDYGINALNTNYIFNKRNSTYVNLDLKQQISSSGQFQSVTSDYLSAACKLSTGKIACFGLIQSAGKLYYKPELVILK